MKILGVETATFNCSVGLVENGIIIREESHIGKSIHSEMLITLIDDLFGNGKGFEDVDNIAVSIGPGSYTGLRIGLSTAKGLALPRNLPVLPVPTLKVLETVARTNWKKEDLLLFVKSHKDFVYFTVSYDGKSNPGLSGQVFFNSFENALNKFPQVSTIVGDWEFPVPDSKILNIRYPAGGQVALIASMFYEELLQLSRADLEPEYFSTMQAKSWDQRKSLN